MWKPSRWLPLAAVMLLTNPRFTLTLPVPDEEFDTTTRLLGSSVVTSVSVVMGQEGGNEEEGVMPSDSRKVVPVKELPASPAGLLRPDRFQFYTFDNKGDVVTKQMTEAEIQSLIAAGGGQLPAESYGPQKAGDVPAAEMKVADVVQNVQNVLKGELSKPTTVMSSIPTIPGHANAEWSNILPSILAGDVDTAPLNVVETIPEVPTDDKTDVPTIGSSPTPEAEQPTTGPSFEAEPDVENVSETQPEIASVPEVIPEVASTPGAKPEAAEASQKEPSAVDDPKVKPEVTSIADEMKPEVTSIAETNPENDTKIVVPSTVEEDPKPEEIDSSNAPEDAKPTELESPDEKPSEAQTSNSSEAQDNDQVAEVDHHEAIDDRTERPMIPVPVITVDAEKHTTQQPQEAEKPTIFQILNTIPAESVSASNATEVASQEISTDDGSSAVKEKVPQQEDVVQSVEKKPVTADVSGSFDQIAVTLQNENAEDKTPEVAPAAEDDAVPSKKPNESNEDDFVTTTETQDSASFATDQPDTISVVSETHSTSMKIPGLPEMPVAETLPENLPVKGKPSVSSQDEPQVKPEREPVEATTAEDTKGETSEDEEVALATKTAEAVTPSAEVFPTTEKQTAEMTTYTSLLSQGASFIGSLLPESVSSIVTDLVSNQSEKVTEADNAEQSPTAGVASEIGGQKIAESPDASIKVTDSLQNAEKNPEITTTVESSVTAEQKPIIHLEESAKPAEPVFQRLPEMKPESDSSKPEVRPEALPPQMPENSETEKIIESLIANPTEKIVNPSDFGLTTIEDQQTPLQVDLEIKADETKPSNIFETSSDSNAEKASTAPTFIHVDEVAESATEPLPTELADSLSSMISQISEAVPPVISIGQDSEVNESPLKKVDGGKPETASVTKPEVMTSEKGVEKVGEPAKVEENAGKPITEIEEAVDTKKPVESSIVETNQPINSASKKPETDVTVEPETEKGENPLTKIDAPIKGSESKKPESSTNRVDISLDTGTKKPDILEVVKPDISVKNESNPIEISTKKTPEVFEDSEAKPVTNDSAIKVESPVQDEASKVPADEIEPPIEDKAEILQISSEKEVLQADSKPESSDDKVETAKPVTPDEATNLESDVLLNNAYLPIEVMSGNESDTKIVPKKPESVGEKPETPIASNVEPQKEMVTKDSVPINLETKPIETGATMVEEGTETPIVRLEITDVKPETTSESLKPSQSTKDSEDRPESSVVRIQVTDAVATINAMLEKAPAQSNTPPVASITLPPNKISASNIASGLIAGYGPNATGEVLSPDQTVVNVTPQDADENETSTKLIDIIATQDLDTKLMDSNKSEEKTKLKVNENQVVKTESEVDSSQAASSTISENATNEESSPANVAPENGVEGTKIPSTEKIEIENITEVPFIRVDLLPSNSGDTHLPPIEPIIEDVLYDVEKPSVVTTGGIIIEPADDTTQKTIKTHSHENANVNEKTESSSPSSDAIASSADDANNFMKITESETTQTDDITSTNEKISTEVSMDATKLDDAKVNQEKPEISSNQPIEDSQKPLVIISTEETPKATSEISMITHTTEKITTKTESLMKNDQAEKTPEKPLEESPVATSNGSELTKKPDGIELASASAVGVEHVDEKKTSTKQEPPVVRIDMSPETIQTELPARIQLTDLPIVQKTPLTAVKEPEGANIAAESPTISEAQTENTKFEDPEKVSPLQFDTIDQSATEPSGSVEKDPPSVSSETEKETQGLDIISQINNLESTSTPKPPTTLVELLQPPQATLSSSSPQLDSSKEKDETQEVKIHMVDASVPQETEEVRIQVNDTAVLVSKRPVAPQMDDTSQKIAPDAVSEELVKVELTKQPQISQQDDKNQKTPTGVTAEIITHVEQNPSETVLQTSNLDKTDQQTSSSSQEPDKPQSQKPDLPIEVNLEDSVKDENMDINKDISKENSPVKDEEKEMEKLVPNVNEEKLKDTNTTTEDDKKIINQQDSDVYVKLGEKETEKLTIDNVKHENDEAMSTDVISHTQSNEDKLNANDKTGEKEESIPIKVGGNSQQANVNPEDIGTVVPPKKVTTETQSNEKVEIPSSQDKETFIKLGEETEGVKPTIAHDKTNTSEGIKIPPPGKPPRPTSKPTRTPGTSSHSHSEKQKIKPTRQPPKTSESNNKKTESTENTNVEDKWTLIPQKTGPTSSNVNRPYKKPTMSISNDSNTSNQEEDQPLNPPVPLDASQSAGLDSSVQDLDTDVSYFAKLCNELALSFWTSTNKGLSTARSLALSPFGMTSLLAMVFLGARGPTSNQMNDVLKLDDMATFNPHLIFQNVTDTVGLARNQGVANAGFVRELFADRKKVGKIMPFYKEQVQQFYEGFVSEVNFATISDLVRRRTNLLIRKQTGGRIRDFVKSNTVPLRSPLAAISANVFQTDCNSSAASSQGRDGELYFAVAPAVRQRKLVPVPATVWRSGVLAGYEPGLDATAIALGGAEKVVSTIFVIPGQQGHAAPGDSLDLLEQRLISDAFSQGVWNKLLKVLVPRPGLELQIPKFSHRSVINATAALKRMGLEELFGMHADLKGINGVGHDLHLSDILQLNLFSTCGDEPIVSGRHHIEIYPASPLRNAREGSRILGEPTPTKTRTTSKKNVNLDSPAEKASTIDSSTTDSGVTERKERQAALVEKPRLKLDRPFLYFVRHNPTGIILHMGRFNPRLLP